MLKEYHSVNSYNLYEFLELSIDKIDSLTSHRSLPLREFYDKDRIRFIAGDISDDICQKGRVSKTRIFRGLPL